MGAIPTAPTIHLPDGWTLNKNTWGQKGANRVSDPVLVFVCSGTSDNRVRSCLTTVRSDRCFIPQACEQIADTFAIGALFIAGISSCLAVRTFAPIGCFGSNCVNAAAALFTAAFATTTICDPYVVTGPTTLSTTRNRQFSLHLPYIRLRWALACSIQNAAGIVVASAV